MPGILPMKVIKVGVNAQTRIAQACDRCRSKKIRCDGVRPCCSQCANVGFECKTSDKLSRRAFPRGYTESLEERVRVLEAEVRELKDLLDEKDEKIDMLSRIHSQSAHPIQLPSPRRPSTTVELNSPVGNADTPPKDDMFKVQQSPYLLDEEGSDSYFSGTSSVRTFIEAFKHRVQESGRSTADIDTGALLSNSARRGSDAAVSTPKSPVIYKAPPRLVSDQFVNIFFQEWAPLFPILHRPTFLTLYERFCSDFDSVTDRAEIAQLNLVFGIAALSDGTRSSADLDSFESQWKSAIDAIITENSMATLQALILAQLFCIQQGDLTRLATYKGLSTSLSARLGLHQSQKRFALGTLACETRKKVFWSLYAVDSFTAVLLGLPKHIKDEDVCCEIPIDADDEYVTERGFQPTLPGESTKLSSALALFRASRILSKVLEEVFPAKASYELSLKKLSELSDELDNWINSLPSHLRLHFAQDKPSTGTISSRSPLLSLTYHYIRALIHRPAVCASLGARSQSSVMATASSCKHIVQIIQLLDERGMSFSFCLNRDEMLVLAGFGLLFQGLGLDPNSKILRDNSKMLSVIIDTLTKSKAPCAAQFEKVATSFMPVRPSPPPVPKTKMLSLSRHNSDGTQSLPSSTRKQLKAIASRFTANSKTPKLDASDGSRRATVHNISLLPYNQQTHSQPSLQPPTYAPSSTSRSEPARSPVNMYSRPGPTINNARPAATPRSQHKTRNTAQKLPNLDYLSFGNEPDTPSPPPSRTTQLIKPEPGPTDWEKLLGSLDNGETNIYDACYGGPPVDALLNAPSLGLSSNNASTPALASAESASIAWNGDLWAICQTDTNTSSSSGLTPGGGAHTAGSILSFSSADEGLSSSEDFTGDWTTGKSGSTQAEFRGIVLPQGDDLTLGDGWTSGLNL
ncbi:Transcriptional activator acu-15 [Lecanosticta acicola]|uniref:Transcriptional activator acu-15 n=1 Tax=Lecanosticta acicola TaxID=111012 RepID=A0AAI8Z4X0_9PEZI|nr:Transcriptional activator acu-15 [Lecanosticta acicola]